MVTMFVDTKYYFSFFFLDSLNVNSFVKINIMATYYEVYNI